MDKVRKAGVTIPISPGIMPVTSFKASRKWPMIGIQIPELAGQSVRGVGQGPGHPAAAGVLGFDEMCAQRSGEGLFNFHFYTLNRADLTYAICRVLGVREPETPQNLGKEAAA